MKAIQKLTIPGNICLLIQKYDIEYNSRKNIIIFILSHPDIQISELDFLKYQKECDEKLFSFEVAKQELEKQYVFPLTNNQKKKWKLNYDTNQLTIYMTKEI